MKILKIASINRKSVQQAIKKAFNPKNEEYEYDLQSKYPYCQIKNDFYLIVEKNDENYKTLLDKAQKSIKENIQKQLGKFSKTKLDDKTIEDITANIFSNENNEKKINDILGKQIKIKGDFLFIKDNNMHTPLLTTLKSEEQKQAGSEGYVITKNVRGFYGLRNPQGELVDGLDFKERFNGYKIISNRYIVFQKDGKNPVICTKTGKKLFTEKSFKEVWSVEDIGLPKDDNLLVYQDGSQYGILNLKTKKYDVVQLCDDHDQLKQKYEQILKTNSNNTNNAVNKTKDKNNNDSNINNNTNNNSANGKNTNRNQPQLKTIKIEQLNKKDRKQINKFLTEKGYKVRISRRYKIK